jgi:hypothetical protein
MYLVKDLMENIKAASAVSLLLGRSPDTILFARFRRIKPAALVRNDPPVFVIDNVEFNQHGLVWVEIIAVLRCVNQRFLQSQAQLRSPTRRNISQQQVQNWTQVQSGRKAYSTPLSPTRTRCDCDHSMILTGVQRDSR